MKHPPATALFLCLLLSVVCYLYYPAAGGPYVVDDIPNLVENDSLLLKDIRLDSLRQAALSSQASQFHRPLAMLSFAANYTLAGDKSSLSVKITNILLHLLTGLGIYLLTAGLLPRFLNQAEIPDGPYQVRIAALLVSGFWLLHPLFVSTVLYSIQRMAILSTLFIIYGCLCYLKLRRRQLEQDRGMPGLILGCSLFTLLAFLSKENGALLPGFLLLIEVFCFNFRFHPQAHTRSGVFLGTFLIVPPLLISGYLLVSFGLHSGEALAPYSFTPWERLLTEARVLWGYAGWLCFLNPEPMGLYHDDLMISTGLATPWSTLPAVAGWALVLGLTAWLVRTRHIVAFGLLWFLWGHCLESTVLPLAPMFEHRNYQPAYGLILVLVTLILHAMTSITGRQTLRWGTILCLLVLIPCLSLQARVDDWRDRKSLTLALLRDKPGSAQSLIMVAQFLLDAGDYQNALLAVREAQQLDPEEPSHILAEAVIQCHANREAAFSEGLSARLRGLQVSSNVSVNTIRQLRQMIPVCQASRPNGDTLLVLYERLSQHRDNRLAMLSLYGSGTIHMQRLQYAEVVRDWEQAITRDADAVGLTTAIDWAREQVRQGQGEATR